MKNALIRKLERWATLCPDEMRIIEELSAGSTMIRRGEHLVQEGDQPSYTILMLEGWACRYKILRSGKRLVTAFLLPGDICDMHIFILSKMDHSIVALSPARIVKIQREALTDLFDRHPGIARAFWWSSMVDEAVLREWLVNLGGRNAYERIAHLLCELHWRAEHVGLVVQRQIDLPLTQADIGDALGLTSVHVNRVLGKLRQDGLIQINGRAVVIPDPARLRAAAGFDPTYLHEKSVELRNSPSNAQSIVEA